MNSLSASCLYDFTATDRFPLSREYRGFVSLGPATTREPEPSLVDPFTERHLHCVWYDERLRPASLVTARGEPLRVLRPGRWNFEAGPDFLDAEWEVGGRRVRGDVEIHIRPMDWRHHGHHEDPRYENVRLHVTHEPGSLAPGLLPRSCEEASLKAALDTRSHFFFDSIDTSAYPWDVDSGFSTLRAKCEALDDPARGALLDAAGQERLRRKTLRMARAIHAVGPEQALYQAVLRALGYKHNADPCEDLARRLPLHELRSESCGNADTAHAVLLGVAGLLPGDETPGVPPWLDARDLWGRWWRMQDQFAGRQMDPSVWRLDNCRPGNRPLPRLRAAAEIFSAFPPVEEQIQTREKEAALSWVRRCKTLLQVREPGAPGHTPRLVGPERAAAILINALVPWRAVMEPGEIPLDLLRRLPPEPGNAIARRTAHALFGPNHSPRVWQGTLRKQGLLQFHEDYGL